MDYKMSVCENSVKIDGIYTVHYFEYMSNFKYKGERHDFWEIVYADRRGFSITAGDTVIPLRAGQLYLHKPNEFHNIHCDDGAANSAIISFGCRDSILYDIAGKVITCGAEERRLIGSIIREASETFTTPLGILNVYEMKKSDEGSFGSEQLLILYLEQLLIHLLRGTFVKPIGYRAANSTLYNDICKYLERNVENKLHFSDIQKNFNVSESVIKRIFKTHGQSGVMDYFNRLKVETAKTMIREGTYNFTEIAELLSFNTSQYFTTVFKRVSGMTPSEYAESVKSNFTEVS